MIRKNIENIFDIRKNDIISITGSGGKTSLMLDLAKKLKKHGRVLITTSTKIRIPNIEEIDEIYKSLKDYVPANKDNIIVCLGEEIRGRGKLSAISEKDILRIKKDFDYILIEADGCRNLPMKMWKDYEPVIYSISNKTIGVFSVKVLGKKAHSSLIYNYEEFEEKINKDIIDEEVFLKLILGEDYIFKNFYRDKYVFINQADREDEKIKAKSIIKYIKNKVNNLDFKLIYGSIKNGEYYEG